MAPDLCLLLHLLLSNLESVFSDKRSLVDHWSLADHRRFADDRLLFFVALSAGFFFLCLFFVFVNHRAYLVDRVAVDLRLVLLDGLVDQQAVLVDVFCGVLDE